ncbi:MAG: ATP-binding cassette domain-containing protein [Planctomycetes bacterium]|nr:ATP-binding cassette domain-containing protein [Planctomycetota bacterium]
MIRVETVTKYYGPLKAVEEVSFEVGRDQIVGFVGPNGAGKSTVLKMLATYLLPTSGRLSVDGFDAVKRPLEVRRRIGYLPGDTPLYQDMRADRFLAFIGKAHGLSGAGLSRRLEAAIEACRLEETLSKRIKECSTGFRKRIGLAASLIHDPEVLLLDEPTHGLDPLQVLAFRELLRKLRPGRAILLSSHVISEVAAVSDGVLIIHNGRLLADGKLAELCQREGLPGSDLEGLFVHLVRKGTGQNMDGNHGSHEGR